MNVVPCSPHWVAERIPGCDRGFGECTAMGVERNGRLIAGVVYHSWCPEWGTIEMSGAAIDRRWMTRSVIHRLLAYPFGFCRMVVLQMEPGSTAHRIWMRLGADEYRIPRLRGPETDGIIATLARETWVAGPYFMGVADGQIQRTEAA